MSNIPYRRLELFLLCFILGGSLTGTANAQVGHPPESSPYRDMRSKFLFSVTGGNSWGSGGKVAAGPADGPILGTRLDVHLGGPGSAQIGVNWASLNRMLIDPSADESSRSTGPVRQSIFMFDVGLILTLSGQKTWHGLAPYFGGSLGIAMAGPVPGDTLSTFEFGTKFITGPQIGLRWHPVSRLFLRIEGRYMFWKLSYPDEFFEGDPPVLDPLVNRETDWTHNPMLLVSLGIALK